MPILTHEPYTLTNSDPECKLILYSTYSMYCISNDIEKVPKP